VFAFPFDFPFNPYPGKAPQTGQAGCNEADLSAFGGSRFIGESKIFATKALRHKGYIYYSFFVPWCLSGKMEKVLLKKHRIQF
jgi:hypothetical protein